jgi:hypothetical protein
LLTHDPSLALPNNQPLRYTLAQQARQSQWGKIS